MANKRNRSSSQKPATITDKHLSGLMPKGDRRLISDLKPEERARLERLASSKRPTKVHKTITLARPRTEPTDVVVPTLEGKTEDTKTESVERVVDLLTQMYNRRDISQIQYSAGERYRTCFEMLSATAGGAGDFDRVRGGGSLGIADTYVSAAKAVSDARLKILYPRDYAVLHRVCVEGKTFERVAQDLASTDLGYIIGRKEVGYMLKSALSQLAAAWWPDKAPKIDQSTLDHLSEDGRAGDQAQFLIAGTPEWDRVQHYRELKGLPPLVAQSVRINKVVCQGAWLREEAARLTGEVREKSLATDSRVIEAPAVVAHVTRDKVFYSNKDQGKKK